MSTDAIASAAEPATDTSTTLDRFVDATIRKANLEGQLRAVKAELAPLAELLLEEFAQAGVSGQRHAATGRLVSITRKVWARAETSKDAAADALIAAGLGDYVERGFNTNSLSAYFREELKRIEDERGAPLTDITELLPEQLQGAIALTQDQTLSVRA